MTVRGLSRFLSVRKHLHQILQIDQRPDKQAAVRYSRQMIIDQGLNGGAIEIVVNAGVPIVQELADIIDTFALEPSPIGSREALLFPIGDVLWHVLLHHLTERDFAVAEAAEILLTL